MKKLNSIDQIVIAAGGAGTRLLKEGFVSPKSLIEFDGVSVLERILISASEQNINKGLLLLHHGSEQVIEQFKNNKHLKIDLNYVIEETPLGNGGCLKNAESLLEDNFFYVYGDLILEVDFARMAFSHFKHKADITLLAHPSDHPFDADLVETDENNLVTKIQKYPHEIRPIKNLVNTAVYAMSNSVLKLIPKEKSDFASEIIPLAIQNNFKVMAYKSREYVKDMGTADRVKKVAYHLSSGLPKRMKSNYSLPIFFFTIQALMNVSNSSDFSIRKDSLRALKLLNDFGCLCVVSIPEKHEMQDRIGNDEILLRTIDDYLGQMNAFLDSAFVHNQENYKERLSELKKWINFDNKCAWIIEHNNYYSNHLLKKDFPCLELQVLLKSLENLDYEVSIQSFCDTLSKQNYR